MNIDPQSSQPGTRAPWAHDLDLSPGPVTRALWAIAAGTPIKAMKVEANPDLASIFGTVVKKERTEHPCKADRDCSPASCAEDESQIVVATSTVTVTPPRKPSRFDEDGIASDPCP